MAKRNAKNASRRVVRRNRGGRPTKLNAETQKRICDAIIVGATYEAAAEYAGVDYQTFHRWMERGAKQKRGGFSQFCQSVRQANAQAQVYFSTNIKQAASGGDWRAAAWMLERRFPKAYGQRIGAIDEKEIDDAIESELARMVSARQAADAEKPAREEGGNQHTTTQGMEGTGSS